MTIAQFICDFGGFSQLAFSAAADPVTPPQKIH
jgi:hypothetical protein